MAIVNITQAELNRQKMFMTRIRQDPERLARPQPMTYFLITFGCQQNENDSEHMAGLLDEMGYLPAAGYQQADLILLNTCSVRENADDRLFGHLGMMKNLRRDRPDVLIGLCGCMMTQSVHVDKIKKSYPFVDLIFGPQDIYRLPELLGNRLSGRRRVYDVGIDDTLIEEIPVHRARKFRALVSIMYGCNNFCTYCIVPFTRGRERSRDAVGILAELRDLAAQGYKEILLLGQNVNSYGSDLRVNNPDQPDFAGLLSQIARIPGLYRIRFMTSHPKDISDDLLAVIGQFENIEPHLHLPLQSGSDRLLKKMNRHYTHEHYLDIATKARHLRPDMTLSTDLIVGFPGETEEDFQDTLNLMAAVRFDSAFTFIYSKRQGTPAAEMPDQISEAVIKERFQRLVALQNQHSLESNRQSVDSVQEVLIEGSSEGDRQVLTGRTGNNRLVNFTIPAQLVLPAHYYDAAGLLAGDRLEGHLAQVLITRAKTFSVEGRMEKLML